MWTLPAIEYAVVTAVIDGVGGDPIGDRIEQPMIDADADDGVTGQLLGHVD